MCTQVAVWRRHLPVQTVPLTHILSSVSPSYPNDSPKFGLHPELGFHYSSLPIILFSDAISAAEYMYNETGRLL
jgi:hypothetical protein